MQLSAEALKFLPDRNDKKDNDTIYPLSNNGYTNETLKSWILAAGITKRVTFHVGRHTNATLLLSLGVPIETISKILGHADIQTTQIYAKLDRMLHTAHRFELKGESLRKKFGEKEKSM